MKIEDFIKKASYDYNGQMIFGQDGKQLLLDVRGWGAIHTNPNIDNPEKFQDDLGEWVADAINRKIESQKSAIPLVRCFKAYGEELIKELAYELVHQYEHDQFHTNRYRKGLLIVEFTYESEELLTVELTIDETYCKPITFKELEALTPVLGEYPE